MKKIQRKMMTSVLLTGCLVATLASGCGSDLQGNSSVEETKNGNTGAANTIDVSTLTTPGVKVDLSGDYSEKAINAEWSLATSTVITFDKTTAEIAGSGASFADGVVTIGQGGTYVLSGAGDQIQIVADVKEDEDIQLVLKQVYLEHDTTAPIYIKNGENVYLTLADGTDNSIIDGRAAYVEPEEGEEITYEEGEEPIEAAIFSEIDLILNGSGNLTVEAGYDDGVRTKDDMEIISGTYHINAQDDAFVGKDSISVRDGDITVVAKGTAFKSNKSDDLEKGYVVVDGGSFDLIATEGDGFHGEFALVINDGDILIRESEEGLEGMNIVINGGNIELTSTDDGVNISEAEDYSTTFGLETMEEIAQTPSTQPQKPEGKEIPAVDMAVNEENTSVDHIPGALIINGGYLYVAAQGDGLDSNGDILITGGTTIVCGPTNAGNGTLDYADSFHMTGGVLAISGNQGMEQTISNTTLSAVTAQFDGKQVAGTEVVIADEDGKKLIEFVAKNDFSYVSMTAKELTEGKTYTITAGTASVTATAAAHPAGGMGGMGPGGQMPGGQRPGEQMPEGQMPEGMEPPQMPEGQMPEGVEPPQRPEGMEKPENL